MTVGPGPCPRLEIRQASPRRCWPHRVQQRRCLHRTLQHAITFPRAQPTTPLPRPEGKAELRQRSLCIFVAKFEHTAPTLLSLL